MLYSCTRTAAVGIMIIQTVEWRTKTTVSRRLRTQQAAAATVCNLLPRWIDCCKTAVTDNAGALKHTRTPLTMLHSTTYLVIRLNVLTFNQLIMQLAITHMNATHHTANTEGLTSIHVFHLTLYLTYKRISNSICTTLYHAGGVPKIYWSMWWKFCTIQFKSLRRLISNSKLVNNIQCASKIRIQRQIKHHAQKSTKEKKWFFISVTSTYRRQTTAVTSWVIKDYMLAQFHISVHIYLVIAADENMHAKLFFYVFIPRPVTWNVLSQLPVSRVVSPPNLKLLHLSVFQSHALDLLEIGQSVSEWVSRVLRPR